MLLGLSNWVFRCFLAGTSEARKYSPKEAEVQRAEQLARDLGVESRMWTSESVPSATVPSWPLCPARRRRARAARRACALHGHPQKLGRGRLCCRLLSFPAWTAETGPSLTSRSDMFVFSGAIRPGRGRSGPPGKAGGRAFTSATSGQRAIGRRITLWLTRKPW